MNKLLFDPFSIPKQFNTTVGFEPILKRLAEMAETMPKMQTYPPYNIKKIDENKYTVEIAVAGFARQDLEIELDGDKLIIKGNVRNGEEAEKDSKGEWTWPQVLYQGLAQRPFTRTFSLADNVEIQGASLINGILKIALEAIIPEHKKPKKIDINDEETSAPSTAEYLAERKEK